MAMTVDLAPVLAPGSLAIVGASERSSIALATIENCRRLGYAGVLYPVHPRQTHVLGLPCYPSLAALPERPDCVLIALNAERALAVVEEAAALGIPALVIPAGGFAERGPAGLERQRRIVSAARAHGLRVVGPNCMGVISTPDRAAVYIGTIARSLTSGNVSAITQSGSIAHLLVNTPELALARLFSSGNEAVLTACDYLDYLVADDCTEVIMLGLEAYREPQRLLALAERALEAGKPLVTLALGRSEQARSMAQAHSGALATHYRRMAAALRRRGALLCDDLDEWIATAQLAARGYRPRGAGVGAVTVSGGEAALLLDLAGDCGVTFPPLSAPQQRRLTEQFPGFSAWTNPSDGWDKGPWQEVIPAMLAALADEPDVDVLVAAVDVPAAQGAHEADYTAAIGRALGEQAARAGKPAVYISLAGGALDERVHAALHESETPLVGGARWGLRAIAHLAAFSNACRHVRTETPTEVDTTELDRLVAALPTGPTDEAYARRILALAGLPLVPATEVVDEDGAVAAAALPGPAVLKAIIPGLAHKSDAGAVALRLASGDEVRQAARRLLALCDQHVAPRRLLVGPYLEPSLELICGVACDPDWGAFVVLGLGGVLAEAFDEVAIIAAPFGEDEVAALLASGRLGRLLTSPRRPTDTAALARLLHRLGWLADHLWRLNPSLALDLNPVMLMPPGQGAWAADALITSGQPSAISPWLSAMRLI